MSLITHCPVCGTTFKVVRDQLRISDGWVRCGHCSEVFDSTPNLRELDLADPAGPVAGVAPEDLAQSPMAEPLPPVVAPAVVAVADEAPSLASGVIVPDIALDELPAASASEASSVDLDAPTDFVPSRSLSASVDHISSLLAGEARQEPLSAIQADVGSMPDDAVPADVSGDVPQPAPAGVDFSFIAAAKTPPAVASRWVRWAFAVASLMLLVGLALQVVVQERDRLAATQPSWRPALQSLCGIVHCQIRPWRHIEAISVDASSFNKLRGDTYRLGFTLKNAADMDLAYPAIELTLTDSQDTPLLRRVLEPAELSPRADVLTAGGEWSGGALVAVAGDQAGGALARRIAGYRILAFYP